MWIESIHPEGLLDKVPTDPETGDGNQDQRRQRAEISEQRFYGQSLLPIHLGRFSKNLGSNQVLQAVNLALSIIFKLKSTIENPNCSSSADIIWAIIIARSDR